MLKGAGIVVSLVGKGPFHSVVEVRGSLLDRPKILRMVLQVAWKMHDVSECGLISKIICWDLKKSGMSTRIALSSQADLVTGIAFTSI